MLEALVVGGVEEDLGLQAAPRVAIVHGLPPARLVPALVQRRTDVVHRHLRERRRISLLAYQGGHLKEVRPLVWYHYYCVRLSGDTGHCVTRAALLPERGVMNEAFFSSGQHLHCLASSTHCGWAQHLDHCDSSDTAKTALVIAQATTFA